MDKTTTINLASLNRGKTLGTKKWIFKSIRIFSYFLKMC